MDKNSTVKHLSEKLYNFFVINNRAAAIQQKDEKYKTMYIPVSPSLIEQMILSNGSMGCYQQGYRSKYIKWVCVDFDCKDKDYPDINKLEKDLVSKLTHVLDDNNIHYLKEFSGRRGIHVWILFDSIITKADGYNIVNCLLNISGLKAYDATKYGIDLFPQTPSASGNIVGKQVKLPLSCHKGGGRSYCFIDRYSESQDLFSEEFFEDQLKILNDYKPNNLTEIKKSLKIDDDTSSSFVKVYTPITVYKGAKLEYEDVISILSETQVYKNIFMRMNSGNPNQRDWYVLLGTFSPLNDDSNFLAYFLSQYPLFDEGITVENIRKLKGKYHPPTFAYLSQIYNIQLEESLDPESTGLEYLLTKKGITFEKSSLERHKKYPTDVTIEDTIAKEISYLLSNDEVPDIKTLNTLKNLKSYDIEVISKGVQDATSNKTTPVIEEYRLVFRFEGPERTRKMVSLSAFDRILTTQLALEIVKDYRRPSNNNLYSFSYNPSLISKTEIFYSWYTSWDNYISNIKSILNVSFFSDYGIFYIDLKSFYESIDFVTVYDLIKKDLSDAAIHKMQYLLTYNDKIMSQINDGVRLGVPQGPAYARIIAEIFLNFVMSEFLEKYEGNIKLYKYVDDMVFICEPTIKTENTYNEAITHLNKYGLNININKSRCYHTIGQLSDDDKRYLLHLDRFNYDLRSTADGYILSYKTSKTNFDSYIYHQGFDIWKLGYYFSPQTSEIAKESVFKKYKSIIFPCLEGRGSNFRRFYEYVLQNEELVSQASEEHLFETIPLNSVNFSNYISTIYLLNETDKLPSIVFDIICKNHLSLINTNEMISMEDKSVINALLLLWGKKKHDRY